MEDGNIEYNLSNAESDYVTNHLTNFTAPETKEMGDRNTTRLSLHLIVSQSISRISLLLQIKEMGDKNIEYNLSNTP